MAISPDNSRYFNGYPGVSPGLMSVGSYQVSGHPFVTGSTLNPGFEDRIDFGAVTKQIILMPSAAPCQLTFVATGSNPAVLLQSHFITFPDSAANQSAVTIDVMCSHVFIHSAAGGVYSLYASQTGINVDSMFPLTGSGIDSE
jgi:hypothetical protein